MLQDSLSICQGLNFISKGVESICQRMRKMKICHALGCELLWEGRKKKKVNRKRKGANIYWKRRKTEEICEIQNAKLLLEQGNIKVGRTARVG